VVDLPRHPPALVTDARLARAGDELLLQLRVALEALGEPLVGLGQLGYQAHASVLLLLADPREPGEEPRDAGVDQEHAGEHRDRPGAVVGPGSGLGDRR